MLKRNFVLLLYLLMISIIYISFIIYFNNADLLNNTLFGNYPLNYKFTIFKTLFTEIPNTFPPLQFITLLITALLTAANVVLLYKRINYLKTHNSLKLIIAGTTILGLTATGCAACGLPLLALLGIGASIGFLPLQGYEFSLITIALLIYSLVEIHKNTTAKLQCDTPRKKNSKKRKKWYYML